LNKDETTTCSNGIRSKVNGLIFEGGGLNLNDELSDQSCIGNALKIFMFLNCFSYSFHKTKASEGEGGSRVAKQGYDRLL